MFLENWEIWLSNHNNLLEAVKTLFQSLISLGLFVLALQAHKISKSNLELAKNKNMLLKFKTDDFERKIFLDTYNELNNGLEIVYRKGSVDIKAREHFWKARDKARLELPKEIENYCQQIFDIASENFILERKLEKKNWKNEESRLKASEKSSDLLEEILNFKPYQEFSKYLKISK